jgi:curved DNA-binding protein CbpA
MPDDQHLLGTNLAETPLASVLVSALKLKVTGELSLHHDAGEDRIYFQGGIPTGTQVFHNFKPLGRFLLDLGWISMQQLEESLVLMKEGQRQGEALVAMGALDQKQVGDALRLLQVRNLVEMARLPQARLEFDGLKPPPPWIAGVPVNALRTLREVLAVPQSLGVCRSLMEVVGGDGADVWIPPQFMKTLDAFELDPDELSALKLLSSPTTLATLFQQANLAVSRASALVAELVVTGMLQATQAKAAPALGGQQLRPPPWAPPRPTSPSSGGVSEEARARRRRLLQRGIDNMGGFGRGHARPSPPSTDLPEAASDALPETAAPSHAASHAASPAASSAPPPAAAPAPPPLVPDGHEELRKRIEARAPIAMGSDLFARLGLPTGASKDLVKQSFVEAAQLFHPDHLPLALASLASVQRDIFTALKEAYDTLTDDSRRRAYEASVRAAAAEAAKPPVDPRAEQAKIAAFQGDQALRKRDYATAADQFHTAYELYANGDYLASEAWALFSDPARSNKKAKDMVEAAFVDHPESERALYYVAMLARLDGKADEAERMFKKVLKMNPRHMEASQELHLLKLRKKKK